MTYLVAGALLLSFLWLPLMRKSGLTESGQRILGHLYEMGVYRDVPLQTLRCLARMSWDSLVMGRRMIGPCLLFCLPCLLVLIPLQACQQHRPFHRGEVCLLSAQVEDGDLAEVSLELPQGLSLDAPPLRAGERREVFWRLRAEGEGDFQVRVTRGSAPAVTKSVVVVSSDAFPLLREVRAKPWYSGLLTPGEANLPGNSWLRQITVDYPARPQWLGDRSVSWLVQFLIAFLLSSAVMAFVPLRPRR